MEGLEHKQKLAFIHVTSECNLRCPYCWSVRYGQNITRSHMTQDTAVASLKWIRENCDEGCEVHLFGGEPLLNWPLVKFILDNYGTMELALTTNATLLTDEIVDKFWEYRDSLGVVLSIDGPPEDNERFRGKPYNVELVKRLLKRPLTSVRMVSTDANRVFDNAKYIVEHLGSRSLRVNYRRHMENPMKYYETLSNQFKKINEYEPLRRACKLPGPNKGCTACRAGTKAKPEVSIVTNGDLYTCDMGWWAGWGYVGNIYKGIDWDLWAKWVKEKDDMYAKDGIISMCAVEQYMSPAICENNRTGENTYILEKYE